MCHDCGNDCFVRLLHEYSKILHTYMHARARTHTKTLLAKRTSTTPIFCTPQDTLPPKKKGTCREIIYINTMDTPQQHRPRGHDTARASVLPKYTNSLPSIALVLPSTRAQKVPSAKVGGRRVPVRLPSHNRVNGIRAMCTPTKSHHSLPRVQVCPCNRCVPATTNRMTSHPYPCPALLRLERKAWSIVKGPRQVGKEYARPPAPLQYCASSRTS